MGLANLVEQANQDLAIFNKMADLLLNNIKGCRCSDALYRQCRSASRHSQGVVP